MSQQARGIVEERRNQLADEDRIADSCLKFGQVDRFGIVYFLRRQRVVYRDADDSERASAAALFPANRLAQVIVHPGSRQVSRSPCIALAVMAMMRGRCAAGHSRLMRRDASSPSITGISTSISTTSYRWRASASKPPRRWRRRPRGSHLFQERESDLLVHRIVVGEQDLQRRSLGRRGTAADASSDRPRLLRDLAEHAHQRLIELRRLDGLRQMRGEVDACIDILLRRPRDVNITSGRTRPSR